MDEKRVFKKSDQVVTREIGDEVIILPLYKPSKELNYIYNLNKTAATAWELINSKRTLWQIKEVLLREYHVSEEKLTKQLEELIKDLKSIKAIV